MRGGPVTGRVGVHPGHGGAAAMEQEVAHVLDLG